MSRTVLLALATLSLGLGCGLIALAPSRGVRARELHEAVATGGPIQSRKLPVTTTASSGVFGDSNADAPASSEELEAVLALVQKEGSLEQFSDDALARCLDSLILRNAPKESELCLLIVRKWAERSPGGAANWAGHYSHDQLPAGLLDQIAVPWANADLPGAIRWASTLPEESRTTTISTIGYEAARINPAIAVELAADLPPSTERSDLLAHAVSQWAANDPTSACAWASRHPDTALRPALLASIAVAQAERDPAEAARFVANDLEPGEIQDRALVAVLQRWALSAPVQAAQWVEQFPDTPALEAAARNLISIWAAKDPAAAANWLSQLPDGSLKTACSSAYAEGGPLR